MKALVTGASGLIGSNVVKALLQKGFAVKALVRTTSNIAELGSSGVEIVYGDVLDADSLKAAAQNCDYIFHSAGLFSYWGYEASTLLNEARSGMENVISAAIGSPVRRVVFTSSSVTLGASEKPVVLSEKNPGNFDEAPAYVLAKYEQEKLAFELGRRHNVDVIAICPTLTVGGIDNKLTESNRMIINYIKDPYKSSWIGGCNIVSVKDVADAMVLLAESGQPGERYVAGSDNLSWRQAHAKVSELLHLPGPYLEAMRTSSYLLSALHELWYQLTKERPTSTREQSKMVGKYYWYSSDKLRQLGYNPVSSEAALIAALSWLVTSHHISPAVRSSIQLHDKIITYRRQNKPCK